MTIRRRISANPALFPLIALAPGGASRSSTATPAPSAPRLRGLGHHPRAAPSATSTTATTFGQLAPAGARAPRRQGRTRRARVRASSSFLVHWREHVRARPSRRSRDVYRPRSRPATSTSPRTRWSRRPRSLPRRRGAGRAPAHGRAQHRRRSDPLRQQPSLQYIRAVHQLVLNLVGAAADPCRLPGEGYDEAATSPPTATPRTRRAGHAHLWSVELC